MAALTDALVFYDLHGIGHTVGEHIASLYHVSDFNFHCTGHRGIHSGGAYCNVVPSLGSFTDLRHTSVCSCQYSAPGEHLGSKKHTLHRIEACRLVFSVFGDLFSTTHTRTVLRVHKDLIINELEQMIRMIYFDIYSRMVPYKLSSSDISLRRHSRNFCQSNSNDTFSSYGKQPGSILAFYIY